MANFIKTWDGRRLEDWGCTVSKEFKTFQQAMKREVKRLAEDAGATLADWHNGHYDMTGVLERDGLFVYFSYSNLDRTKVVLTPKGGWHNCVLMRTMAHAKDWTGGTNNNIEFSQFSETMERLFKEQAHKRLMDNAGVYILEHTSAKGYRFVVTLFDWGIHARVTAQDGTLLYHKEIWPGTWSQTYDVYEASRRSMMNEDSAFYWQLDEKAKLKQAA